MLFAHPEVIRGKENHFCLEQVLTAAATGPNKLTLGVTVVSLAQIAVTIQKWIERWGENLEEIRQNGSKNMNSTGCQTDVAIVW